jgi:ATP-dependent DNA helicase RecQ
MTILLNGNYFDQLSVANMEWLEDETLYPSPNELVMQLTHKDVNLGYFYRVQSLVNRLTSGDTLIVNGDSYLNSDGQPVLTFSQKFSECIKTRKAAGYTLQSAKINFITYWWQEEYKREIKIILPEVLFVRK